MHARPKADRREPDLRAGRFGAAGSEVCACCGLFAPGPDATPYVWQSTSRTACNGNRASVPLPLSSIRAPPESSQRSNRRPCPGLIVFAQRSRRVTESARSSDLGFDFGCPSPASNLLSFAPTLSSFRQPGSFHQILPAPLSS